MNKLWVTSILLLLMLNTYTTYSQTESGIVEDIIDGQITTDGFLDDMTWLHDQGYNGTGIKVGIMELIFCMRHFQMLTTQKNHLIHLNNNPPRHMVRL